MKRHLTTIILIFIAFGYSYSQDVYEIRQAMDFYRTNKFHSGDWRTTLTENDIQGSPFLNDEFISGIIYTTSKQKYVDVPLRYNIYNDQMEFKTPEDVIQAIATPEIVEAVEFGNIKMVYLPFSNKKKVRHGYLKVVLEGNVALFSRQEVIFKKAEEPGAYKEAVPARFVKNPDTYYIKTGTAQAKKIGSKKELIEIFPDHQNEVAAFIKKNKTKISKPESLKELVQYYNSL